MTTLAELITAVRRRVADAGSTPVYADAYYIQALDFATDKINFDFGTSYVLPAVYVPPPPPAEESEDYEEHKFLLIKLGTIEMAFVRATESATGEAAQLQSISVPDLSVSKTAKSPGDFWMSLVDKLQAEYDKEMDTAEDGGDPGGFIASTTMFRQSLRTGGSRPYEEAVQPTAVVLSGTASGTTSSLTWSRWLSTYFWLYEIWRDTDSGMTTKTKVHTVNDNQTCTWDDEGLASGTYYYQVTLVDRNGFEAISNTVTQVIS